MSDVPVMLPEEAQEDQVRELYRMMKCGSAALVGTDGRQLKLPDPVYRLLLDVLRHMQQGKAVSLVPVNVQLTTQRAANHLGVSRPFLIKLLERGDLPYHKVGTHRRIYLADVLAYQQRRDAERRASLNRLARQAFDAGLYDAAGIPEGGSDE